VTTGTQYCGHPRSDDPAQPCKATSLPGGDRCLAHASDQVRDQFLAGLTPGG